MNYKIREIMKTEIPLLDDFLYEAIFIPEGVTPPPKDIIEDEELLRKEVVTRYFGSSTKAILTAYHDALQRYKKVKSELIKERWALWVAKIS